MNTLPTLQTPIAIPQQAVVITQRILSIDILRALTMVLMIFVNDLWTLQDAPTWMHHVERGVDGIGLADVVYPGFLFIVGMSLFFALKNRISKGDTDWQLLRYILQRTTALLVMGLFLVNSETFNGDATGFSKSMFNILCCTAFILIWNAYSAKRNRTWQLAGRATGIVLLLVLAIIYRGGADGSERFGIHWWGILGGIAWAYFASALIMLLSKDNAYGLLAGWVFFCTLSMASKAGLIPQAGIFAYIPSQVRTGTLVGLSMGGVLTAWLFQYFRKTNDNLKMTLLFLIMAGALISLSVYTRTFWGLAKLGQTPAWLFLCSAFTMLLFIAVYWVADLKKKAAWFAPVKAAGSDTLLCYLVPYLVYAAFEIFEVRLPEFMLTGIPGLTKSVLFALLCVGITAGLNKTGIRLKL